MCQDALFPSSSPQETMSSQTTRPQFQVQSCKKGIRYKWSFMHILCILISYSTTYRLIDSFKFTRLLWEFPTSTSWRMPSSDVNVRPRCLCPEGDWNACRSYWEVPPLKLRWDLHLTFNQHSIFFGWWKTDVHLGSTNPRIPVSKKGLVWDFLLNMSCQPGGDWNPAWRVDPMYSTISGLLKQSLAWWSCCMLLGGCSLKFQSSFLQNPKRQPWFVAVSLLNVKWKQKKWSISCIFAGFLIQCGSFFWLKKRPTSSWSHRGEEAWPVTPPEVDSKPVMSDAFEFWREYEMMNLCNACVFGWYMLALYHADITHWGCQCEIACHISLLPLEPRTYHKWWVKPKVT